MKEYYIKSKYNMINVLEGTDICDCNGIILFVHGLGTHMQYVYNSLDDIDNKNKYFTQFNYKVFGFEFHGHGKSYGAKCMINNFDDLVEDLSNVIKLIETNYPNKKIILVGESMGCSVIIKYTIDKFNDISGIILLSPMCGINDNLKPSNFMINVLELTSWVIPWLPYKMNKTILDMSIENHEYKTQYLNNPYTFNSNYPICTLREIYNTSILMPTLALKIDTPTLIIHGKMDNVTNPDTSIEFYNNISNTINKKLIIIDNKGHNLLVPKTYVDKIPNQIYEEILSWADGACKYSL
jgi:alpha-beta hydrolase superfamily lysophospholipase